MISMLSLLTLLTLHPDIFDDVLNINNIYFDNMVSQIYPLQLLSDKVNTSDTKVRKKAKIRNRYNQVPHLTQDTYG